MSNSQHHGNRQPPKILFVEDNFAIQKGTKNLLNLLGCEVDIVNCGYSALEKNILDYDLILLDMGLPDISGIEVCKKVRSRYRYSSIPPIIAYTACGKTIKQACHDAGIKECVVKPSSLGGLASLLKRHINWGYTNK